jgi:hypothetical protein
MAERSVATTLLLVTLTSPFPRIGAADSGAAPVRIESSLRETTEACPIRLLIPLRDWLDGKRKPTTVAKARMVECDGAKVAYVGIEENRTSRGRGISIDPRVTLPPAEDLRILIDASLLATDGAVISKAKDDLPGDRGEINWGARLDLPFGEREDDAADLLLEVKFRPR